MIITCRFMPQGICLNLFGTFWTRDSSWIDKYVINHEKIHTAQQRELLFIPFYIFYILEWIVKFLKYRNMQDSYYNISFEREAYLYGHDLSYLRNRKHYTWLKYLSKR